jgi:murein DD-endopeptidase MepM/ murein hydrolase activator NlpD
MARPDHATGPDRHAGRDGCAPLLERFDYLSTERSPALLSLAVRLPLELPPSARPALILEREAVEQLFSPRMVTTSVLGEDRSGDWLWRGVFAVPSQLVAHSQTTFAMRFLDDMLLLLPTPSDRRSWGRQGSSATGTRRPRRWPYTVRRGALLLVVTCQLCLLPGLAPGALADGPAGTPSAVEPAPEAAPEATGEEAGATPQEGAGEEAPQPGGQPEAPIPTPPSPPPSEFPSSPPAEQTPAAPGTGSAKDAPAAPASSAPRSTAGQPQSDATAASTAPAASASAANAPAPAERVPVAAAKRPHRSSQAESAGGTGAKDPASQRRRGKPAKTQKAVPAAAVLPSAPVFEGLPAGFASLQANEPPAYLVPIYKQAGHRYGVPWRVLAAINQIETDYGQNLSTSSAGAVGWMQFMPATWQRWGVDADRDGFANPYSPQDAIFTAARYLQASGAARDLPRAIFAYNHAGWYVAEVLLRARTLANGGAFVPVQKGYALPLDAGYMQQLGRTDDGVDIETPPDGALVYSITPGVVSAVAGDPAGFGPSYPVVQATSGSLTGQHIYYGHVAQSLVQPGQQVAAGQPIAIVGHTGDAASLGHGHIEIGFSDAGGAPLNRHGAEAWTPAGSVMRAFLVELSASFGVHSS